MGNYREGQKVFAYVVMSEEGPRILAGNESAVGTILVEKRGRGETHRYDWDSPMNPEMTYWHARKAGRGFYHSGKIEWDDETKEKMKALQEKANSNPRH